MPDTQASEMLPVEQDVEAAISLWNGISDVYNQWPNLSSDEQEKLITAFTMHRINSTSDLQRQLDEAMGALRRIADARTAMDGGSIAECRRIAKDALANIKPG